MSQGSSTPLPTRAHNPSAMSTAVPSPTSSVIDLEINHGVIIRDAEIDDPDVAEDEEQVGGVFTGSPEGSEERKKTLREQLRKTLSSKDISTPHRLFVFISVAVIYQIQTLPNTPEYAFLNHL